jgi:glycosyltransferase involved in cell wall biosynthesis
MVSYSDVNSGNATRILNLAKNLPSNVDVDIVFDGGENNRVPRRFEGLSIGFTPYLRVFYPTLLFGSFSKFIRGVGKGYDIVHCFKPLPNSFIPALLVSKVNKSKLILDWDDWEGRGGFAEFEPRLMRGFMDHFQRWSIKRADAVVVVSRFLEGMAKRVDKRAFLVPNGADVESFRPDVRGKRIRESFGSPLIVFVGLLYKSCDLDIVLRAMVHVVDKVNAKLLVVGDGPRKGEFMRLAEKVGVINHVFFVGQRSRETIPEFVGAADVVVLPMKKNLANHSRSPVKLGEYMAAGKALVASNVGVAREVIRNRYNGILTSNDPREFGEALIELIENHKLRRRLGREARKTAEMMLDWRVVARKLSDVYETMFC